MKYKSLINLVGKVSNEELVYQLKQLHAEEGRNEWLGIINLVGKVSNNEIVYQIKSMVE